jgi:dihydropteroate synthase
MNIFQSDKPLIMGILNVTADSFSDGGRYLEADAAVSHAVAMVEQGADIIDVGGESTRPGAQRVVAAGQKKRVLPVIEKLRDTLPSGVLISIDTTLAAVAEAALQSGASMINDISGGRDDEDILRLAADRGVPMVLMHMQGSPATMQEAPAYNNVVEDIRAFLLQRAEKAEKAGMEHNHIILDPGIGFGKTREHNLTLLANLNRFVDTGYTILLGTSRKRFMGSICHSDNTAELVGATCATTALGIMAGVRLFRVHDVLANRQAADVAWAIKNSEE